MGTIVIPTLSSGVTDAEALNDALYSTASESPKALNGYLTSDNLAVSSRVGEEQIRDQALANGKMVGQTGLLDFAIPVFAGGIDEVGAFITIPGAAQTFCLPYSPSVVIITWQILLTNSQRANDLKNRRIKAVLDGSQITGSKRDTAACRIGPNAITGALDSKRDYFWAGHSLHHNMTKGFHTVDLRLYSNSDTIRVKNRNIKVIWFR